MFGALKRGRFRSLASLILVVNVVGEIQRKTTLAASRGFLAAARLSCKFISWLHTVLHSRTAGELTLRTQNAPKLLVAGGFATDPNGGAYSRTADRRLRYGLLLRPPPHEPHPD